MYSSNGSNRIPQDRIAAEWQTPHGLRITARSLFRIPFRRRHTGRRPRSGSDRPDHPGRNASHDRALENIFGHNRSCRHDDALADGNAGENRRVRPDPNVFFKTIDADSRSSKRGISAVSRRFRASTCCENSFCAIVVPHISKLFRDDIPRRTVKPRYPGERTHPFP